ncbi:MAG: hypothetical protein RIS82_827 [Actinomycetota bacterium]
MPFDISQMNQITLNNGQVIPQLGLGVYKVAQAAAVDLIGEAIATGYRRIDTAALYGNEQEVGQGIRESGIAREEIFVTTKIWNDRQGRSETPAAIEESLERLNLGYVDMLLIHWPCPTQDLFLETWQVFEDYLRSGLVRGIGVSNFQPSHLESLIALGGTMPALNQVELHPSFQQPTVRTFNANHGIATEAWAPLGRGRYAEDQTLAKISRAHNKSVAQVILRWHLQLGTLVIPKTTNPERLVENISVFDFELTESEMAEIANLNTGARTGLNPDEFG